MAREDQRLIIGPPTVMWRGRDGTIYTETITTRERMAEWTAEREAEEEEAAIADEIARADEQAADEAREEAIRYAWERSAAGQAAMRARDDANP
jgi:hypothetical protein